MEWNMRTISLCSLALLIVGCGGGISGNPTVYRIAVDQTALESLPAECFVDQAVPTTRENSENIRSGGQWTLWEGSTARQFLEVGTFVVAGLGNAAPVDVGGVLESADKMNFTGRKTERTVQPGTQYSSVRTLTLTVHFDEMAATTRGTIDVSSEYQCTDCANNDGQVSCAAKLTFNGRRIDGTNDIDYSPAPAAPAPTQPPTSTLPSTTGV
jgi:hypothetical protein